MTTADDFIAGAAQRRSDLEQALNRVERAAAAPAANVTWSDDLTHRMRQLEIAFNQHIVEVEGPSALLDQIVDEAPRLQRAVEETKVHHAVLAQSIAEILRMIATNRNGDPDSAGEIRRAIVDLLADMARHRQNGADLIYEAYDVDIGGY